MQHPPSERETEQMDDQPMIPMLMFPGVPAVGTNSQEMQHRPSERPVMMTMYPGPGIPPTHIQEMQHPPSERETEQKNQCMFPVYPVFPVTAHIPPRGPKPYPTTYKLVDTKRIANPSAWAESDKILTPDYFDDEPDARGDTAILRDDADRLIYPSYPDVRRKTLRALYGIQNDGIVDYSVLMDKSPKGSVDEGIRELVDLINSHPSFATLSSCSGRITLFDPNHKAMSTSKSTSTEATSIVNHMEVLDEKKSESADAGATPRIANHMKVLDEKKSESADAGAGVDADPDADATNKTATGKGHGAWLISSHAKITTSQLMTALDEHAKRASGSHHALMFKHEPLLLHVAASNMKRSRQLLTLALNLGFRESGLVVTEKRITVAIRTHGLTLAVPIASGGRLRPNDEFLEELVREANERFDRNVDKLNKLKAAVEEEFFQCHERGPMIEGGPEFQSTVDPLDFLATDLPEIYLWGHSAVAIPSSEQNDDVDLIVLGGQGQGPDNDDEEKKSSSARRSEKVFGLSRRGGQWDESWSRVRQAIVPNSSSSKGRTSIAGIEMQQTSFSTRVGSSSCLLPQVFGRTDMPQYPPISAIFGGRTNPAKPYNDLLFMIYTSGEVSFFEPLNVRGEIPSPRYGHCLTALSGHMNRLALLTGGRDKDGLTTTAHILSYEWDTKADGSRSIVFVWERLPQSIPRFYHNACNITMSDKSSGDKILVLGGLSSLALANKVLAFNRRRNIFEPLKEDTLQNHETPPNYIVTLGSDVSVQEWDDKGGEIVETFGSSSTSFPVRSNDGKGLTTLVLLSGGLQCPGPLSHTLEERPPIYAMQYLEVDSEPVVTRVFSRILPEDPKHLDSAYVGFGTMVHHCCIALPPRRPNFNPPSDDDCMAEFVLLGGGAQTFGFTMCYGHSYHVRICPRDNSLASPSEHDLTAACNAARHSGAHPRPRPRRPNATKRVNANGRKSGETDVIWVESQCAKEVKTILEQLSFLDRNYRMTKVNRALLDVDVDDDEGDGNGNRNPSDVKCKYIAIPITLECHYRLSNGLINQPWQSFIVGRGKQDMPFSTAVLGRS